MTTSFKKKIKKIKLLTMDVDGVLTDGKIILDHQGRELKNFDVQDGFGIVIFRRAGFKTAVISARKAPAVTARMKDLKVDKIYQNARRKLVVFKRMLKDLKVETSEVCFMGDDLPDLSVIKHAGLGIAVANAATDVKRYADYVTKRKGGRGAVREVVEMILKEKGLWKKIVHSF